MIRVSLLLMAVLFGAQAPAWAQTARLQTQVPRQNEPQLGGWEARWKLELAGQDYDNEQSASKLVNVRLQTTARYFLTEDLLFKISPTARLQSGATQSSQGELSPDNRVYVNEASATWRALPFTFLKAGAMDQGELHTPLVVGSRPFPGARLSFLFGDRHVRYGLVGETAIPTSVALTTNQSEKESTPTLNSVFLRFDWRGNEIWSASAKVGAFEFRNPNSAMAASGFLLGNEVDAVSDTEYRFNKDYRGLQAQFSVQFPLMGPFDGRLNAEAAQNTGAASGENQAWRAGGGVRGRWNARTDLLASGEVFRIEPDATIAGFVDSAYSGTNRNGYRFELGMAFGPRKTKVLVGFSESDLIYLNDRQSRDRFAQVKLEMGYADF